MFFKNKTIAVSYDMTSVSSGYSARCILEYEGVRFLVAASRIYLRSERGWETASDEYGVVPGDACGARCVKGGFEVDIIPGVRGFSVGAPAIVVAVSRGADGRFWGKVIR